MKDLGLKWHVLGKLTIIYILVFAWAIIPVTASKYVSQAESSSSARVARIDCNLTDTFTGYSLEEEINLDNNEVYAIIAEFSVTNNGEVTYSYDLSLVLSEDTTGATFDNPNIHSNYTFTSKADTIKYIHNIEGNDYSVIDETTISSLTGKAFSANHFYYAQSNIWNSATLDSKGCATIKIGSLNPGETCNYKILYFMETNAVLADGYPQMTIFYSIKCTQLD